MDDSKDAHPSPEGQAKPTGEFLANYSVPTGHKKLTHRMLVVFFSFLTLLVFYQTRMCTEFMGSLVIERAALEWHAQQSKRLRQEVVAIQDSNSPETRPTVVPHRVFFGEGEPSSQSRLIIDATNALLGDQEACNSFPSFDGISLTETSAVVVPLWKMDVFGDRRQAGITEAGWVCSDDDSTMNPSAVTIREKPVGQECYGRLKAASIQYSGTTDGTPQMTKDGIPRIALSKHVLTNFDELKLTLFHEFMHTHAVPAYRPFLNWVHDDLTYLHEYNSALSRAGLLTPATTKWQQETALWVIICAVLAGVIGNAYWAGWWWTPSISLRLFRRL